MTDTITTLLRDGFILVFNQDRLDIVRTAEALMQAGIGNMEVTCRISQPLEKLARLRQELPGFVTGAASLIDRPRILATYNKRHASDPLPSVGQAVDAGAQYIVSAATFRPATYRRYAGKLPIIPGCGTVGEIVSQYSLGANLVKIFPAEQLGGPAFVKAVDPAIHKTISLVPTGGTNPANIPDYIAAGVLVLGGSFSCIDKAVFAEIVERQDYARLAAELTAVKRLIDERRAERWPSLDFAAAPVEQIAEATGRDFNLSREG
ncbi:MAG: bifunctional 4-hydroxy-2-oxoglutarate aldolase/2-dehydro-3-deoxy-phosphogluconate aldolase [Planctomycetota bacterium]